MTFAFVRRLRPAVLSASLILSACDATQGPQFSEVAVSEAIKLRDESLALLGQADRPFTDHAAAAEIVRAKAEAAEAGAAGVPGNDAVAREWELMTDPEGNLLGGALVRWEEQGRLSRFFRDEISAQVAEGFGIIICTEESKREPKACGSIAAGGN